MLRTASFFLLAVVLCGSVARADAWFELADYQALKEADQETAELVLQAMYETVFYAQKSVGREVICASPVPASGKWLVTIVDEEITSPTNPLDVTYDDNDHVAFILMNALKQAKVCD